MNRQLRSILSRVDLRRRNPGQPITRPWFLVPALGVPFLYLGFILASRTRRKMREARGKNRSKHADAEALKKLAGLRKGGADIASEEFFKTLGETLIGFIEDRLEVKALGDWSVLSSTITSFKPDLTLLDIVMPVVGGATICSTLRRQWPDMKIVLLSELSEEEIARTQAECGAHGGIRKSRDPTVLVPRILHHLQK